VTQKIDLETVIQECVLAKRAEHSPRTAEWYELAYGYFLQFLKENNPSTRLADVGISEARSFVVWLQTRPKKGTDKPLSSHTINCWV